MIGRLNHVAIAVKDLAAATALYRDTLGARVSQPLPQPECYAEMIRVAETLSKGFPLMRVDLYEINHRVYFGEMTLYPGSGLETFQPVDWDYKLGDWVELNKFFPKEFES